MSDASSNTGSKSALAPTGHEHGIAWGPLAAIVVVLVSYIASSFLGSLFSATLVRAFYRLMGWNIGASKDTAEIVLQFVYVVLVEGITIYILWLFLKRRKTSFKPLGFTRKPKWADLVNMLIGFAGYFVLYAVLSSVLSSLVHLNLNQKQDLVFNASSTTGALPLTLAFISLVILPPLVEETVFRGFLFRGLRTKLHFWVAALITSLLFAVPHMLESSGGGLLWIGGLDTFILSVVLCTLREKTGSLWPGIGVHALKNALAFVSLFIFHLS
jgi:membrane protease YdiL (CAAX protease family)